MFDRIEADPSRLPDLSSDYPLPPEQIEGGQGMILSIACPTDALVSKVEALCRQYGAAIHRQRS